MESFFVPYIPSVSVGILTRLYINDRILAVIKTEKRNVNIAEQAQNTRRNQKMLNQFSRTELLIGIEGMEKLKKSDMIDTLLSNNVKLLTAPPLSEWGGQSLNKTQLKEIQIEEI